MKKNTDSPWRMIGLVGTLGLEVVTFIVAGVWIGRGLDAKWGTDPLFLAAGILAGLVMGLISAAFTLRTFLKG